MGGAALSGLYLHHRLSRDIDLFCDSREDVRDVLSHATEVSNVLGGALRVVRDGGTFVRGGLILGDEELEIDLAYEPSSPLAPRSVVDGVTVDSLVDLHANKVTCLLSRAEPRDLVDLCFLEREGLSVDEVLPAALAKDAGIDPGVLSLLLRDFPTEPLPVLLRELDVEELVAFRDELSERLRVLGVPSE